MNADEVQDAPRREAFYDLPEQLRDLDELPGLLPQFAAARRHARMDREGLAAARHISIWNDRLSRRIIDLVAQRHRLPPVGWCWLALGSEARHEQTLVSDQDNGLVFSASGAQEARALRALFLPFAEDANEQLAAAGFTRCPGEIMAGNPAWCLSFDEWRERFGDWVRRPEPEALLNASIFFDLRAMHGDHSLVERLQTHLLALTRENPLFQRLMAINALTVAVPLGFRGDLSADAERELDLKKFGSRVIVDAARIFALAHGSPAVNTLQRLKTAGPAAGMGEQEIAVLGAAFSHLLRLRLTHQHEAPGSVFSPAGLHDMDRVILREALRQAKRLQLRLKLNYSL